MAEPLSKAGQIRPPTRNELAKFLPNHESIIFMENLFRIAGTLLPTDIQIIYDLIEAIGNTVERTTDDFFVPEANNYSVIADASIREIDITLPLASTSEGYIAGITKVDSTNNRVRILPTDTDTIAGESFQDLLAQHEVLNFVSDGSNWQLAN